ncbi:protein KRTCAP2 homolog, partial [Clonorchis sinensis]
MAMSTGLSCLMSSLFSIILFAGMRLAKEWLCSSKSLTILGGFLGSILFVLILTVFRRNSFLKVCYGVYSYVVPLQLPSVFSSLRWLPALFTQLVGPLAFLLACMRSIGLTSCQQNNMEPQNSPPLLVARRRRSDTFYTAFNSSGLVPNGGLNK